MEMFEWMRIKLEKIPAEIVKQHSLNQLEENGWIFMEIKKVMYEIPWAEILANAQLT